MNYLATVRHNIVCLSLLFVSKIIFKQDSKKVKLFYELYIRFVFLPHWQWRSFNSDLRLPMQCELHWSCHIAYRFEIKCKIHVNFFVQLSSIFFLIFYLLLFTFFASSDGVTVCVCVCACVCVALLSRMDTLSILQ
jgi:hypothetical protein